MATPPSPLELTAVLRGRYPKHAGCLLQVFSDLSLAQQWDSLRVLEAPSAERAIITGRRPSSDQELSVVPCALHETLSIAWIKSVFDDLHPSPAEVYLAITSDDSSIVYYKLSKGIVKPPN